MNTNDNMISIRYLNFEFEREREREREREKETDRFREKEIAIKFFFNIAAKNTLHVFPLRMIKLN